MPKEVPLGEGQARFQELVEELQQGGEPVCFVQEGKAQVVMLNIDDYQMLITAIRNLSAEWEL